MYFFHLYKSILVTQNVYLSLFEVFLVFRKKLFTFILKYCIIEKKVLFWCLRLFRGFKSPIPFLNREF